MRSTACHLEIHRPPTESKQPALHLALINLKVQIGGTPAPRLQWYCNNKQMAGETADSIEVDPAVRGVYACVATNSAGTVTIPVATLPDPQLFQKIQ